jgi:predicted ester cyclase
MTKQSNKATARRVLEEFFSAGNLELAAGAVQPNLVQHHPDEPYETRGPAGMRERIAAWRTAFPDLSSSIEDLVAEGDRVALRSIARGGRRTRPVAVESGGKAGGQHVKRSAFACSLAG